MHITVPTEPRASHPTLVNKLLQARDFSNDSDSIIDELGLHKDELLNALYVALDALGVIAKTPSIANHLMETDPMALNQVNIALGLKRGN